MDDLHRRKPFTRMSRSTPFIIRAAARILSEDHHCLIGDIEWSYHSRSEESGPFVAVLWLWWAVFSLIPRLFVRDLLWQHTMLKNYLTVALRQFRKYKSFSAINVLGLALSMSVCLLILTMIQDFRSDDSFHTKGDRIYRVTTNVEEYWGTFDMATSAAMMGPELLRELDDVEALVQMKRTSGKLTRDDGRMATFAGLYAQNTFFDLFDFELVQGNPAHVLDAPFKMVVTQELAARLFPDRDPFGQLVDRENGTYEISGVVALPEARTHLAFDVLISHATLPTFYAGEDVNPLDRWNNNSQFYNYLLLKDGASVTTIEQVANRMGLEHHTNSEQRPATYALQTLGDINLGPDLSNQIGEVVPGVIVWVLSIFALLLIGTAAFNYVNLTVSRALRRTGEIGVRKVVGAHRSQLIQQFVAEAVVTSLLSLVLALVFLQWLVARFNGMGVFADEGMTISMSTLDPILLLKFVLFAFVLGTVAGIIPALKISRLSPVVAFRGATSTVSGIRFLGRKALVVFQFGTSMIAIVTVLVLFRQADYLMSADIGFDAPQLLHLNLAGTDYDQLATELRQIPGILQVAATSYPPSAGSSTSVGVKTPEMDENVLIQKFAVDDRFLDQYNIDLIAGRNYSSQLETDKSSAILLSESALSLLGLGTPEEALGKELIYDTYSYDERVTVIGVFSDFYSRGFEKGYQPTSLAFRPEMYGFASIRVATGDPRPVLRGIEDVWDAHAPGLPADYQFLDDVIQARMSFLTEAVGMLSLFAILIVIIASLGLLGMAMFSAEIRLKEVGIRKTLGADTWKLIRLLSSEYVRLIVIAVLLAAPAAYVLNSLMLSAFANRIELEVWHVLLGIVPVLLLAILTIGTQTLKAANANPVDVMRSE